MRLLSCNRPYCVKMSPLGKITPFGNPPHNMAKTYEPVMWYYKISGKLIFNFGETIYKGDLTHKTQASVVKKRIFHNRFISAL